MGGTVPHPGGLAGQHLNLCLPATSTAHPPLAQECAVRAGRYELQHSWYINGKHCSLTLEAWLACNEAASLCIPTDCSISC